MTLDRFGGGGITAVSLAAAQIMSGMEALVIAGGTEMMSYTGDRDRQEAAGGIEPHLMGSHNAHLEAMHPQSHQGVCADAIAAIEGISRGELEALGVDSQVKAARAIAEGRFDRSLVAVTDDEGNGSHTWAFWSCI